MKNPSNVSYDELFDILQQEKNSNELKDITDEFFTSCSKIIEDEDLGSYEEQNVRETINQLIRVRHRKILRRANTYVNSRGNNLVNTAYMTEEEEKLYGEVTDVLERHREKTRPSKGGR